jgi:hypothetical protein
MHAVSYAVQVVAGINYFIKVQTDLMGDHCVHLRVYQDLQQRLQLAGVQKAKKLADELTYFDASSAT